MTREELVAAYQAYLALEASKPDQRPEGATVQ
jgi:hypothetical protein